MPVDLEFIHGGAGVLLLCRDVVRGREMNEANELLLGSADRIRDLRFALVDMRRATSVEASTDEIRFFAYQDRRIAAVTPSGLLVAVVAEQPLAYGLARMWEAFADEIAWETQAFWSGAAAETWLRMRVKEKFKVELAVESKLLP